MDVRMEKLRLRGEDEAASIDNQFQEDDAGELAPILQAHEKVYPRETLPANYMFTEQSVGDEYTEEFDAITRRYDASDPPVRASLKHPENRHVLFGSCNAILYFSDIDIHFGCGLSGGGGSPWIKMDTQMHSQHPSIKLIIKDPDGNEPNVVCHIFPGSIKRDANSYIHFSIRHGKEAAMTKASGNHPELIDLKAKNGLMETRFTLWSPKTVSESSYDEPVSPGERPVRLSWTGISLADVEEMREEMDSLGPSKMSKRRRLIALLAAEENISIFRPWYDGGYKQFEIFQKWFECAFQSCAYHGYEWFYALQMRHALDSTNVPFRDLKQPRWLATEFKATVDEEGELLELQPHKVAAFAPKSGSTAGDSKMNVMLPTPEVAAFDRDEQRKSAVLQSFFKENAFKIKAVLIKHPDVVGKYLATLHPTAEGRVASVDRSLKLDAKTRARVFLKVTDNSSDRIHRFKGIVVDDLLESGSGLTLMIEGTQIDFDKRSPPAGFGRNEFSATVKCIGNPTPTIRWKAAIQELSRGELKRSEGIDVRHLVLNSPQTIVDTGSMSREALEGPQTERIVEEITRQRSLNLTQVEAVRLACTGTTTGLATIRGPPGTGKTHTLAAIVEMQVAIGRQLSKRRCGLAVAPSHFSVEQLAKSGLENRHQASKMECVYYRGTFLGEEKLLKERKRDALPTPESDDTSFEFPDIPFESPTDRHDRWEQIAKERRQTRLDLEKERQQEDEIEEAIRPMWQLAEKTASKSVVSELSKLGFHKKRLLAIKFYASTKKREEPVSPDPNAVTGIVDVDSPISLDEHIMVDKAVRYLALHDKVERAEGVKKNDLEKASHKNDVDSMHMLEEDLTEYYFQNDVDMVYCTNSTSASGLLRKYYKPKFIIQDEATVTTVPDAATPLGAYHESVELVVQAGDPKQHHHMSTSKGFNEHLPVLRKSLFEMALVNSMFTASFVTLMNRFRTHPEIADVRKPRWRSLGQRRDHAQRPRDGPKARASVSRRGNLES
jgi:hypothetical protein